MRHEIGRWAVVDRRRVDAQQRDAPLLHQQPHRLGAISGKSQLRRVSGRVVAQVALPVAPETAPAGAHQHDRARRDPAVRRLECLDVGARHPIGRVAPGLRGDVDDDRWRHQLLERHSPVPTDPAARSARARRDACRHARACRAHTRSSRSRRASALGQRLQLECRGRRRPVDRALVERMRQIDDPPRAQVDGRLRRRGMRDGEPRGQSESGCGAWRLPGSACVDAPILVL